MSKRSKKIKTYDHKREYLKNKRYAYVIVALVVTVIWFVLLGIKIATGIGEGEGVGDVIKSIGEGIFDNILGIIPPILIFDFGIAYLQQDKIFEEMTEEITGTIMSKPEVIQSFDREAQKRFLNATVLALVDHENNGCSMAMGAIEPYINNEFDVKNSFEYYVDIHDIDDNNECFSSEKYMLVQEQYSYEICYLAKDSKPIGNEVRIGFFIENKDLDKELRGTQFIMREKLSVDLVDFNKFTENKSKKELEENIINLFTPRLFVDDIEWQVKSATVEENKIFITFVIGDENANINQNAKENKVSMYFNMPQLKNSTYLVSVSQPTYSPIIRLNYPESKYNVQAFPFFSRVLDASVEQLEHGVGSRYVRINDKWVHPMSGVLFVIDEK